MVRMRLVEEALHYEGEVDDFERGACCDLGHIESPFHEGYRIYIRSATYPQLTAERLYLPGTESSRDTNKISHFSNVTTAQLQLLVNRFNAWAGEYDGRGSAGIKRRRKVFL